MAGFLLELYDNEKVVGLADRESFCFRLADPLFPYAGNSSHNQQCRWCWFVFPGLIHNVICGLVHIAWMFIERVWKFIHATHTPHFVGDLQVTLWKGGHMTFLDCWTPITYERYCNAYHGAYMGFITKKGVKSFRVKGILKGVKNLYIASQWFIDKSVLFFW